MRGDVARTVYLSKCSPINAKIVQGKALWGERKVVRVSVPYWGGSILQKANASLWDLPCSPPQGFDGAEEKSFRVPGNDSIEDCAACLGRGKVGCGNCGGEARKECAKCGTGKLKASCEHCRNGWIECYCDAGFMKCATCDGNGMVLKYDFCETHYRVEKFDETLPKGKLPDGLVSPRMGVRLIQDYEFCPSSGDRKEHTERRLAELAKQAGSDVKDELEARFFRPLDREDEEHQLICVQLEVTTIPVHKYTCEPKEAGRVQGFDAWLYGQGKEFLVSGCPRTFTWKATAWLSVLTLLGAPLGFALTRVVSEWF